MLASRLREAIPDGSALALISHPGTGLLGISVETLLSPSAAASPMLASGGGPVGKVRELFDEVSKLPRRQQDKIVEFLAPIVEEFKRKTG